VKIVDAVDTIGSVDGEGNTVQTEVAHDASETLRVVWFTRRSQDPIENRIRTHAALFQTIQVTFLTIGFAINSVERLALEATTADTTGETSDVIHAIHSRATRSFTHHFQTAIGTHSEKFGI